MKSWRFERIRKSRSEFETNYKRKSRLMNKDGRPKYAPNSARSSKISKKQRSCISGIASKEGLLPLACDSCCKPRQHSYAYCHLSAICARLRNQQQLLTNCAEKSTL